MIRDNILALQRHISSICSELGRNPQDIILVGVTKYTDQAKILEAVQNGLKHIGESRVQDAVLKLEAIKEDLLQVKKHFIGHLQTNKVKQAVAHFDIIQSVDSLKLASEIDKQAGNLNKPMEILLQVNIAEEEQKYGLKRKDVRPLIQDLLGLKYTQIKGFMTMAPLTDDESLIRDCFRGLRLLRDEMANQLKLNIAADLPYLSMGMSNDYKIALQEGSNMIRIGSAIFG